MFACVGEASLRKTLYRLEERAWRQSTAAFGSFVATSLRVLIKLIQERGGKHLFYVLRVAAIIRFCGCSKPLASANITARYPAHFKQSAISSISAMCTFSIMTIKPCNHDLPTMSYCEEVDYPDYIDCVIGGKNVGVLSPCVEGHGWELYKTLDVS